MYLDAAEEKMLRAIVQTAVVEAAAGHPFNGVFRGVLVSARRFGCGIEVVAAEYEPRIILSVGRFVQIRRWCVVAARAA